MLTNRFDEGSPSLVPAGEEEWGRGGHAVTVVEQGPHLEAIRETASSSFILTERRNWRSTCARSKLRERRAGPRLLAVKAYTIAAVAPQMRAMFDHDTIL